MATVLLSVLIVLTAIAGLAAGVLAGRRPLVHSCGGADCADGTCACGRRDQREPGS
jgi:hypothetical protein